MTKGLFWFCLFSACACAIYFTVRTDKKMSTDPVRSVEDMREAANSPSPSASLEQRLVALERLQGEGLAKTAQQAAAKDVTAPAAERLSPEARAAKQKEHFKVLFGHLDRVRGSEAVDEVWQTEVRSTLSEIVVEAGPAAAAFSRPEVSCGKSVCRLQFNYDEGEPAVRQGVSALVRALGHKPNVGGGSFYNDDESHRLVGYLARPGQGLPRPQ